MDNFRVSVKAFIMDDTNLLVIKRDSNDVHKPNIWEFPGGRLDLGEDPFEGLKRETKEETGVDIEIMHPLNVRHVKRDDGQTITMLIFLCKALNNNVKLSPEHTEYDWLSLEKAKEKLPEFFHEDIDKFNKLGLDRFV